MARSMQQNIAGLMDRLNPLVESPSMVGMSTLAAGGSSAVRDDATLDDSDDSTTIMVGGDEEPGFTDEHLKIAKRFIELMGGADRAREIVDKVDECEECLGLVDSDAQDQDSSMIDRMAGMLPSLPDLPMELSNLYNPAASGGPTM